MRANESHDSPRLARFGNRARALLACLTWSLVGCATAAGPHPPPASPSLAIDRRVSPAGPAALERAQGAAIRALEALAEAREQLLHERDDAVRPHLEAARAAIREARVAVRPEVLVLPTRLGGAVELRRPPRVELARHDLDETTLRRLWPSISAETAVLTVDLERLAEHLDRALTAEPREALFEVVLATSTAVELERRPRRALANEEAELLRPEVGLEG